ncbi:T9SS type A sorting domain-containing protein [Adhaeribacter swui]|uniref:T9SS type A sorting domain-containing protein n=1 Tax=Adhaeribacter swui TaxID=2086471 RepID=A0A7G7G4Q5_9BACT|nr:T9SS type A sorting domain-containing protein [Adhaeribacter swui]QNF32139.1 T9SS type A sorting domain-containing protein [Adhaeribacter swui]
MAQNILWDKTYGGNKSEFFSVLQPTHDGGYIVGGTSDSGVTGDKSHKSRGGDDYWVIKLNADGSKVWDKTFGGNSYDYLHSIQQTQDSGYILSGFSNSGLSGDKSEPNKGGTDYWVIKITADGTKEWDKTIGSWHDDGGLIQVRQTQDGGYIVGGSSYSGIGGDKTENSRGDRDYWIVKLNSNGVKQWDKTYGGKSEEYLNSLELTTDGGLILSGHSTSGRSGNKTQSGKGQDDYWIIKTDGNGSIMWDKTIGGSGSERGKSIVQQTPDGGYILGASSNSDKSGDKSENNRGCDGIGNCSFDYWVLKLNADGSKAWDKTYGGNAEDNFETLQQTPSGDFILGGWSSSNSNGDKTEQVIGATDFWVIKLKPDGSKVWDKTIGSNGGDELHSIGQTPDGNFILGGSSWSNKGGDKSHDNHGCSASNCFADFWVVKMDNSGRNLGQIITFLTIPYKTLGDVPFTLSAKSSSGLPVSFRVISGPATLKGNTITLTGTGTVQVKASAPGNKTYLPAQVTQSFEVEEASPVKKVWDKTLGGKQDERLYTAYQTPDGGFILGGNSGSGKSGNKSDTKPGAWIVKLRADGTKVWDKVITGGSLAVLQPTPDGGYILGGSTEYNNNNFSSPDYWLVKLKADGNKEWEKALGGYDWDELTALQQTQDGGYILGGSSYSGKGLDKSEVNRGGSGEEGEPVSDYWVVKVNATGTKEWDKTLGGDYYDNLTSLQQTSDGGYIVGGSSMSGLSSDKSEWNKSYGSDYWIVKLRPNGSKEWDKTIGGNNEDYLAVVQQTPDGGYILAGSSSSGVGGDKSEPINGDPDEAYNDFWVVKLGPKRNKEWDKTLGGAQEDHLNTLLQIPDGSFILGGSSSSVKGGDKSQVDRGGGDIWLIKITAHGTTIWDKTLGGDEGDGLTDLQSTPEGGYILGGNSTSNRSGDKSGNRIGENDFWIIKLKEEPPLQASWNMRYGGSGKDNLTTAIKTSDGRYLSGGYTTSGVSGDKNQTSQGKNDYWIVKSDQNGKKLWDQSYGGSQDDYLNSIVQTADGGYLLAGSSASSRSGDKSQESRGDQDYWVVKVNASGTKLWDKRYGGTGTDELTQVLVLPSGSFILAGTSNSPASGDISQNSYGGKDYWVLKISRSGKKIWDTRLGGAQDETLEGIVFNSDGGFLVGGTSASGISGTKTQMSQGSSDFWVVRLTGEGEQVWDQRYGGSGEDQLMALGSTNTSTGNFFLAGTSTSGKSGDKSQSSQDGKDYWLIKINPTGKKIWDKRYGGSADEELRTISMTPEGGYLLGGSSSSGVSGDKSQVSQGGKDYWLVKTTATGVKEWDQRFGGSGNEELRSMLLTKEGNYVLAGRSDSGVSGDRTQPSQGSTDYWLVKVAPTTSSIIAVREESAIEEPVAPTELVQFTAFPNPFQNQVTVSFTLPETQSATLTVYDSQGYPVTTLFQAEAQANQTYQLEWQANKQEAGLYFLQLQTQAGQHTQKLLLQK